MDNTTLRPPSAELDWLPVMQLGNILAGIRIDAVWCFAPPQQPCMPISTELVRSHGVAMLETGYEQVCERIRDGFLQHNVQIVKPQSFPFVKIAIAGLTEGTDYWATLALNWLEAMPVASLRPADQTLRGMAKARHASTRTKMRAGVLLQKLS
jgi:hypothetical protein